MLKRIIILATLALAHTSLMAQEVATAPSSESSTTSQQEIIFSSATQQERIAHRCNRGLSTVTNAFVPKGQWIVGATGSYSTHINDNYTFTLIDGINSDGYTLNVSPLLAYAVNDNLAIGGRFEYGRTMLNLDSALLSIALDDESIDIAAKDYFALTSSYTAMAVMRQYIPLGRAKRFALFTEVRLEGGYFQSKFAFDQPVEGTYSEGYNFGLGVVPGIVAFATNEVAFEVMIGVLGVGFSHTDQTHNQVSYGDVDSTSVSFKINIFSIGLGVSFYL